MSALGPFLGVWVLQPERCDYGTFPAPSRGVYTIRQVGDALSFHIHWSEPGDGSVHETSFRTSHDGSWDGLATGNTRVRSRVHDGALTTEFAASERLEHASVHRVDGDSMTIARTLQTEPPILLHAVYSRSSVKQVIVYRRDLKMRKGKIAAQVAHASLRALLRLETPSDNPERMTIPLQGPVAEWVRRRFAKVVLSVESEADLLHVHQLARERGMPTAIITDAGKTEFAGVPTRTTVAVGPWAAAEIDEITGPTGLVTTKLA